MSNVHIENVAVRYVGVVHTGNDSTRYVVFKDAESGDGYMCRSGLTTFNKDMPYLLTGTYDRIKWLPFRIARRGYPVWCYLLSSCLVCDDVRRTEHVRNTEPNMLCSVSRMDSCERPANMLAATNDWLVGTGV